MSQIVFAELNSRLPPSIPRGTVVYRGENSFFIEAARLEKDLAKILRHARFQIRGSLVEIEGSWFEGVFERQTAFLFKREVLRLDLKVLMRSLNCCAVRMYRAEHSTTEAACLLIGHERPALFGELEFDEERKAEHEKEALVKCRDALLASYRMNRQAIRSGFDRAASFLS